MYVPSGANTPSMPALALGAPHTTSISGWPFATSTCNTWSLSALGCFLASATRAMVKAPSFLPASSIASTSRPMAFSLALSSSTVLSVSR